MKATYQKNKLAVAISCAYMTLALSPVYASDVELYVQKKSATAEMATVMMMFDTSGSMAFCIDSTATTDCTDVSKSRGAILKSAVQTVLNGSTTTTKLAGDIKMGLSRYQTNGNGGWVVYPARPLNALVGINTDGKVNSTGVSSDGAALQINSTGVGLYFPNIQMPLGALVNSAKITFVASSGAAPTVWEMEIEDAGDAQPFSVSAPLAGRTLVDKKVKTPITTWAANGSVDVDVTDLVSSIAAKATPTASAWCGGNAMVLKIKDLGANPLTAFTTAGKQPVLTVTYTMPEEYLKTTSPTASCIVPNDVITSTFILGRVNGAFDSATAKLDDVEWKGTTLTKNATTLSMNNVTSPNVNQVAVRLTADTPVPANAVINSAQLKVTPSASFSGTTAPKPTSVTMFDSRNLPVMSSIPSTTMVTTATIPPWSLSFLTANITESIDVMPLFTKLAGTTDATSVGFVLANASNPLVSSSAAIYAADNSAADDSTTAESNKRVRLEVTWRKKITNLSTLTTVRKELLSIVDGLTFAGGTPLTPAYAETSRYLYGLPVFYKSSTGYSSDPDSRTFSGTSYISPLTGGSACGTNAIFLLTDGAPSKVSSVVTNTLGITGAAPDADTYCPTSGIDNAVFDTPSIGTAAENLAGTQDTNAQVRAKIKAYTPEETNADANSKKANWLCAAHLADINFHPEKRPAALNAIKGKIKTTTVILGPEAGSSEIEMRRVASVGGGIYARAADTQALVNALKATAEDPDLSGRAAAAAAVTVNQLNRLNSLDQVYYSLFNPELNPRWEGNLKRFKLDASTSKIVDSTGANAVDSATGLFADTSKSFWSSATDGANALSGGAASRLPSPEQRKIYTYVQSTASGNLDPVNLSNPSFVTAASAKMRATMVPSTATVTDTEFLNLMNWFKGYNITNISTSVVNVTTAPIPAQRKVLGGGLHSNPAVVNYGVVSGATAQEALTDATKQDNTIYFSTLGGALHGVNTNSGEEIFAFIPGEKLGALKRLYQNVSLTTDDFPEYGLDSTWTIYRKDANQDGQITAGSTDAVYLYGGMRMGGSNYYALDLTDRNTPKMLFTILGGTTAGFQKLGQTWSQPVVADIKIGANKTKVLIFGGGYDPCYETTCTAGAYQKGSQLFIVDAITGELYWSASGSNAGTPAPTLTVPGMDYSIPSQPKVMDINADGLADTIYIGDLGGQVFRADINNGEPKETLVKRVKLIAKFGKSVSTVAGDDRRFYEPPTVAMFRDETLKQNFAAVALGTGNRSYPLNTVVSDRFVTIFDYDVARKNLLTLADTSLQPIALVGNMTAIDLSSPTSSGAPTYTTNASTGQKTINQYGWYVNLTGYGEKSMSAGIIFLNRLLFTTFALKTGATSCAVEKGTTNLYEMCMPYGKQCTNASGTAVPRLIANYTTGLSGTPDLIIQEVTTGGNGTPGTAKFERLIKTQLEDVGANVTKVLKPLHRWYEKTRFPAQ